MSPDTVRVNPRTHAAATAWARLGSSTQRQLSAAPDLTVALCACNLQSATVCASHCPRAAATNIDLAATPSGETAVSIGAAATHDNVSWTYICGLSTRTSEAFECHLIDQARDASATLHGRVLHQRPTSAQHSVLFDL